MKKISQWNELAYEQVLMEAQIIEKMRLQENIL